MNLQSTPTITLSQWLFCCLSMIMLQRGFLFEIATSMSSPDSTISGLGFDVQESRETTFT